MAHSKKPQANMNASTVAFPPANLPLEPATSRVHGCDCPSHGSATTSPKPVIVNRPTRWAHGTSTNAKSTLEQVNVPEAVTGSPGSFSLVTCGPGAVAFSASPGVTYYLMAFDDTPGPPNGGTLQISVSEVQPPEAAVTVDPTAAVNTKTCVIVTTMTPAL
jgi:hypothetical protein